MQTGFRYQPLLEYAWTNEVNEVAGDCQELDIAWDVLGVIGGVIGLAGTITGTVPVAAAGAIIKLVATGGGLITDWVTKEYNNYTLTAAYDSINKRTYVLIEYNKDNCGSTDLKLKLAVRPSFDFGYDKRNTLYRFSIDYEVGLKNIRELLKKTIYFDPVSYSECFDYITYDTTQNNVRIVDKNSLTFLDGIVLDRYIYAPVTLTADSGVQILETVNGPQWYIIVGSSGNSIHLDAPDQFTYSSLLFDYLFHFEEIVFRFWQPNIIQLNPTSYTSNQISKVLENNVLFYQFRIEYNQIT
jgi:hypothetical protein